MKLRCFLTFFSALTYATCGNCNAFIYSENPSIRKFQEYLQIDTSQPDNINKAVEFWRRQAQAVGLSFNVYEPAGKPICVITWEGANSSLPSIMLNSHMDVVPVEPEAWAHPPFSGYMDENGEIFGRGTQDTKHVSIQYLEAISALRQNKVTLQRTLHITLMPDEETGGFRGMKPFIKMDKFKELNIGFVLDEGISSTDDTMRAIYVDKRPWQMDFTIEGESGHGSTLGDGTAMQKVAKLVDAVMKMRAEQMEVKRSSAGDHGKYTAVNINIIQGGVARNVIPSQFRVVIDMRLAVDADVKDMEDMVNSWIENAGPNVTMKYLYRVDEAQATSVYDSNRYWVAIRDAAKEMSIIIKPTVRQSVSDMTVLRATGMPALGFSPVTRSAWLGHTVNERLRADTFLHGIQVYIKILEKLGNLSK